MVLQTSGPISLDDIATEFSDARPNSVNEFYGAAAGIPTSGPISFDDFYGTSAYTYPHRFEIRGGFIPDYAYNPNSTGNGNTFPGMPIQLASVWEGIFIPFVMRGKQGLPITSGPSVVNLNNSSTGYNITATENSATSEGAVYTSSAGAYGSDIVVGIAGLNQYNDTYPGGFPQSSLPFGMDITISATSSTNPISYIGYSAWSWERYAQQASVIPPRYSSFSLGDTTVFNGSYQDTHTINSVVQDDIIFVIAANRASGGVLTFESLNNELTFLNSYGYFIPGIQSPETSGNDLNDVRVAAFVVNANASSVSFRIRNSGLNSGVIRAVSTRIRY